MSDQEKVTQNVLERLRLLLPELDGVAPEAVGRLADRPGFDSLALLELLSWLEEEYGLEIDDEKLAFENFDSLDKIVGFVAAAGGTEGDG
ncbi:phosphopantetheine-binding protein [Streptomyces sp. NPDC002577]